MSRIPPWVEGTNQALATDAVAGATSVGWAAASAVDAAARVAVRRSTSEIADSAMANPMAVS